jgi:hypothetical protein
LGKPEQLPNHRAGIHGNPYDRCVVNKVKKEKLCAIIWQINDLKLSHVQQSILEDMRS